MQPKNFFKKTNSTMVLLIVGVTLCCGLSLNLLAATRQSDTQWLQVQKARQSELINNQKKTIRKIKTVSDSAMKKEKTSLLTENQTMDKKFDNPQSIQKLLNFAKRQLQPNAARLSNPSNKGLGNLLIFVSFSMPDNSLRAWMAQAAHVNGSLIIRGLIGNSFKKTIARVNRLLKGNLPNGNLLAGKQMGVQLDPTLFKRYGIEKVPAVVVTDAGMNPDFDVVYGDVPLSTALETIVREGAESKERAALLLKQLRKEETR